MLADLQFAIRGRFHRGGPDGDLEPSGRPVVIIDRSLASLRWPGENPIGKAIRLRDGSAMLATWIPARRATQVDALIALRAE